MSGGNSFSDRGGGGGGGQEEEEEEEEILLVKESAEKCKKCERNVLSNIDVFNSKFCQTTVSDNIIIEGEAALERARKSVQTLKGMVQDLESVAEDALMNVGMNVNSSRSNF